MQLVKSVAPAAVSSWVKPQLVKLGTIADVAGSISGTAQNASKS